MIKLVISLMLISLFNIKNGRICIVQIIPFQRPTFFPFIFILIGVKLIVETVMLVIVSWKIMYLNKLSHILNVTRSCIIKKNIWKTQKSYNICWFTSIWVSYLVSLKSCSIGKSRKSSMSIWSRDQTSSCYFSPFISTFITPPTFKMTNYY